LSTRHAVRIRCFGVGIALGGAALLVPQLAFAHPHHTETVTKVYFTGEQDCVEGQESMLHDQFGIGTISSQAVVSRMPPPFFDIVLSCAEPRPGRLFCGAGCDPPVHALGLPVGGAASRGRKLPDAGRASLIVPPPLRPRPLWLPAIGAMRLPIVGLAPARPDTRR
jgi:hypothetical protein